MSNLPEKSDTGNIAQFTIPYNNDFLFFHSRSDPGTITKCICCYNCMPIGYSGCIEQAN